MVHVVHVEDYKISINDDVNIDKFPKVTSFLKRKSRTFLFEEITEFMKTASDDEYLMMKVGYSVGKSVDSRIYS